MSTLRLTADEAAASATRFSALAAETRCLAMESDGIARLMLLLIAGIAALFAEIGERHVAARQAAASPAAAVPASRRSARTPPARRRPRRHRAVASSRPARSVRRPGEPRIRARHPAHPSKVPRGVRLARAA